MNNALTNGPKENTMTADEIITAIDQIQDRDTIERIIRNAEDRLAEIPEVVADTPKSVFVLLTIKKGRLVAQYDNPDTVEHCPEDVTIRDFADFEALLAELNASRNVSRTQVSCSSTLDFPTDYTSDPRTLEVIDFITG